MSLTLSGAFEYAQKVFVRQGPAGLPEQATRFEVKAA
jgi:hypothetical protein